MSGDNDVTPLLEGSMRSFMKQKDLERWRDENRQAFESYNAMIERSGLLSEDIGSLECPHGQLSTESWPKHL